eukprot:m.257225 g.257225  ORF g.257225 m.257225 type:complete len:50 (+) comp24058_c0_seq1:187-336(+)
MLVMAVRFFLRGTPSLYDLFRTHLAVYRYDGDCKSLLNHFLICLVQCIS